jgi:alcohol dehydrogenase (NADP+)
MYSSISLLLSLSTIAIGQQFTVPTPPKGTELNAIPRIGLGTARFSSAPNSNTSEAIANAIENGFRHIDAAYIYGNQKVVGVGIKEGLKRTGLSRKDIWVTGKLWSDR